MFKKKLLSICISIALLLTACGKDANILESSGDTAPASSDPKVVDPMVDMPVTSLLRAEGKYAYSCVSFETDKNSNASVSKAKIFRVDDQYGLSLEYLYREDNEKKNKILLVNSEGELVEDISLKKGRFISGYTDGKYVSYDQTMGEANILDSEGKDVSSIKPEFDAFDIKVNDDGIWFYGANDIELYSVDGTKKCDLEFKDEVLSFENPLIKSGDDTYAVTEQGNIMDFYRIDIPASTVELIWAAGTADIGREFVDGYMIKGNDVYKIEPLYHATQKIADLGLSNVFPAQRGLSMGFSAGLTVFLDDDHFVRFYPYSDGSIEATFFTYDPDADFSDVKIITVGGFGLTYDAPLNYAISKFNVSNDEYHVRTIEFGDIYCPDKQSGEIDTVKMFKDFAEGNAPDIFYGTQFDYDYMGKAGMVEDLAPYLNSDESFNADMITPSIRRIMFDEEGKCYKFFPCYILKCMEGNETAIGETGNLTIYDVSQLAEDNNLQAMLINISTDMAYDILNPSLKEWWGVYGEKTITEEQLRDIVSFCLENGISEEEYWNHAGEHNGIPSEEYKNMYLLMPTTIGTSQLLENEAIIEEAQDWISVGIPSIDGSHYVVSPSCLLGMSSVSEHKDACYSFMSLLFDYETQRQIVLDTFNGRIPINQSVLENYILSYSDPDNCPDEDFVNLASEWLSHPGMVFSKNKMTELTTSIASADKLEVYDNGLREIIEDEFDDYWSQGKSIDEITKSLMNRLDLYVSENYE
ncbi:MAG: hypothetical protein K6G47_12405 [Clostridia bacterium]|nr:hypothetical protein [Clostridia bacterium]